MTDTTAAVPDENHLIAERRAKLAALRTQGVAFPNDFVPADRAQALHAQYGEQEQATLAQAKHPASVDRRPFRSKALVYEDGELLEWIVSDPTMVKDRPGSFYHAARFVHFSTSDGSDPRSSGKRYEIVFPDISEWN
jgi:hypothetical protein